MGGCCDSSFLYTTHNAASRPPLVAPFRAAHRTQHAVQTGAHCTTHTPFHSHPLLPSPNPTRNPLQRAEDFLKKALSSKGGRFAGGAFDFISVCPPYMLVDYEELYALLEGSPLIHEVRAGVEGREGGDVSVLWVVGSAGVLPVGSGGVGAVSNRRAVVRTCFILQGRFFVLY